MFFLKQQFVFALLLLFSTFVLSEDLDFEDFELLMSYGEDAALSEFPFFATLETINETDYIEYCGATIVSLHPVILLTAAHCCPPKNATTWCRIGSDTLLENGEIFNMVLFQKHFNYSGAPNYDWDVALVCCNGSSTGLLMEIEVAELDFPPNDDDEYLNENITIIGHGIHEDLQRRPIGSQLQKGYMVGELDVTCGIPGHKLCLIDDGPQATTFLGGDDGGPAVLNNVVIGVASTYNDISVITNFSLFGESHYIEVAFIRNWMDSIVSKWQIAYANGQGHGDPHYMSLDGIKFKYDGPCSYILSTNKCNNEIIENSFEIISHHGRSGSRIKNIVRIKAISIIINDLIYIIDGVNNPKLNGIELLNNLQNSDNDYSYTDDHITIYSEKYSHFAHPGVQFKRYQIQISFNNIMITFSNEGDGIFGIKIPKNEKVCGILGNNNNNKSDDFAYKNGSIISFENKNQEEINKKAIYMSDDWMVPTSWQPLRCDWYPTTSFQSFSFCKKSLDLVYNICNQFVNTIFNQIGGKNVDRCFKNTNDDIFKIDGTRIYDDCITEICDCTFEDYTDCTPSIAWNTFKNVCHLNNPQFKYFPSVDLKNIIL